MKSRRKPSRMLSSASSVLPTSETGSGHSSCNSNRVGVTVAAFALPERCLTPFCLSTAAFGLILSPTQSVFVTFPERFLNPQQLSTLLLSFVCLVLRNSIHLQSNHGK